MPADSSHPAQSLITRLNTLGAERSGSHAAADEGAAIREAVNTGWVVFHSEEVGGGDKQAMMAIAQSLGKESDRDGGALWPVAPRVRTGTFSMTAEETGLHTDAQYHHRPEPRFVLFCVVPADCGGGATRLLRPRTSPADWKRRPP